MYVKGRQMACSAEFVLRVTNPRMQKPRPRWDAGISPSTRAVMSSSPLARPAPPSGTGCPGWLVSLPVSCFLYSTCQWHLPCIPSRVYPPLGIPSRSLGRVIPATHALSPQFLVLSCPSPAWRGCPPPPPLPYRDLSH